jgi:hypothetical protein
MSTINENRGGSFDNRKPPEKTRSSHSIKNRKPERQINNALNENYNNIIVDKKYSQNDRSRAPFQILDNNLDISNQS